MSEMIWEQMKPDSSGDPYHGSGDWEVHLNADGTVTVAVADCGCCGPTDIVKAKSVEEFDAEWKKLGKLLRTHVRRGVKKSQRGQRK
ncbi:hypothetical protein [Nocardiopsis tropica]|uniref:Uncharacterized protein n=1 Tax=Nocardiopsis tropica TaxID=109330 RepID=A0ABU7KQV2_9ACTN|nr:hypothetical protein [Nocardiopsis umidischolae]MEE2051671.1 hypothetical protein [Nocardiopsis umidischolae]